VPLLLFPFSSFSLLFSLLIDYLHYPTEPPAWVQPPLLFLVPPPSPHLHLVRVVTPPLLPPSFPLGGAVFVQTWAAQRLVARAGQCGALGGCVSLSPHLWDGLRLSVVSTPPAPPPAQDHVMKLMSNKAGGGGGRHRCSNGGVSTV